MGFLKNIKTALFMKQFKPDLLESEEHNRQLFLNIGGNEELWQSMKSQWLFADNPNSDFYDNYMYRQKYFEIEPFTSAYFKLINEIENNWSIMFNSKNYNNSLAQKTENLCLESIELFKQWATIENKYGTITSMPKNIPSSKRLAMLYEKQSKFEEAVTICKLAISCGMDERSRLVRMINKCNRNPTYEENLIINNDDIKFLV